MDLAHHYFELVKLPILAMLVLSSLVFLGYYSSLVADKVADRDSRLKKVLNKIFFLNIGAKALAVHKLLKRKQNYIYLQQVDCQLLVLYKWAKRAWLLSVGLFAVLYVFFQIYQGYYLYTDPEGYKESASNSVQTIKSWFSWLSF